MVVELGEHTLNTAFADVRKALLYLCLGGHFRTIMHVIENDPISPLATKVRETFVEKRLPEIKEGGNLVYQCLTHISYEFNTPEDDEELWKK